MITCHICGAQNEPINRFCDQCGARLEHISSTKESGEGTAAPAAHPESLTCPNCHTPALPGQAYCEHCGRELQSVMETNEPSTPSGSSTEQYQIPPTVAAPPVVSPPPPTEKAPPHQPPGQADISPDIADDQANQANQADQGQTSGPPAMPHTPESGSTMATEPPREVVPSQPVEPPVEPPPQEIPVTTTAEAGMQAEDMADAMAGAKETDEQPVGGSEPPDEQMQADVQEPQHEQQPQDAEPVPASGMEQDVASLESVMPEMLSRQEQQAQQEGEEQEETEAADMADVMEMAEDAQPVIAPTAEEESPSAPHEAERQQLEEEITRHQQTIKQMEQMISAYPQGAEPAYLKQGLEGARTELQKAQERLDELAREPTGPDPEAVTRLENLIKVHSDTASQFEQMRDSYPAGSVPSFIEDGIREARRELNKVEAELAALYGKPAAPAAPAEVSATVGETIVQQGQPDAEEPIPAAEPHTPRPRLVLLEGKHEFPLPSDKSEFVIGREDPVSHVFPEVDLTSFGGEAGGVSRQHARIDHQNGEWTITDLNSTNHTRVDGNRIDPDKPMAIRDGTRLQFGRVPAIFRI